MLTPWVKVPSSVMALAAIHPTALFISCNSPLGKVVGDCHTSSEVHCSEKRSWSVRRSYLPELPILKASSSEEHPELWLCMPSNQTPWATVPFFMPCRTCHKRSRASFYHLWHRYKLGAVLLALFEIMKLEWFLFLVRWKVSWAWKWCLASQVTFSVL